MCISYVKDTFWIDKRAPKLKYHNKSALNDALRYRARNGQKPWGPNVFPVLGTTSPTVETTASIIGTTLLKTLTCTYKFVTF